MVPNDDTRDGCLAPAVVVGAKFGVVELEIRGLLTTGFTETTRGSCDSCSRSLGGLGDLVGSNAIVRQDGLATTERERVRARIRGGRRGGVPSPPRRGTGRPR